MGVTINHTEVPTHKPLLQTSLSHGFLQKLVQNKPKLKPSTQIKDSDLKVQDDTENKCVQDQGLPPSHSHTEMHANTVSLQITNLAIGFILRPFGRGSNTVTAIPSNPLPTVTTQTQILRLTKTISATENGIIMRICLRTFILFTKLEAKSEASIQPQTNSFSLFHRATLFSLQWVYKLQTTDLMCFTTSVWRKFLQLYQHPLSHQNHIEGKVIKIYTLFGKRLNNLFLMTLKQPIEKKYQHPPSFNLWLLFIFISKTSSATWFKSFYRLIFLLFFGGVFWFVVGFGFF